MSSFRGVIAGKDFDMSSSTIRPPDWTAVTLAERLGPIPLYRVCMNPAPGAGTESDVLLFEHRDDRLFELSNGMLVEKSTGFYESYLAGVLLRLIGNFVVVKKLGIVAGADGLIRLSPGLIRIPDVAFYSFQRLPHGKIPSSPIADLVPDLAIEILSPSNTREEMNQKLHDYFDHGVRLVWYVQPADRTVTVFEHPESASTLTEDDLLTGGVVLSGFQLLIRELFCEPQRQ